MINFYYDPTKDPYDKASFFTTLGTPAIAGSILRFNDAAAAHLGDFYEGDITFKVTIPGVPTIGDARSFGLSNGSLGSYIKFDIADDVFSAMVGDMSGNTDSVVLDFDADWAATATNFRILWQGPLVRLYVNGQKLAEFTDIAVPKGALSAFISNTSSDNMDLSGINFKDLQTYWMKPVI